MPLILEGPNSTFVIAPVLLTLVTAAAAAWPKVPDGFEPNSISSPITYPVPPELINILPNEPKVFMSTKVLASVSILAP